VLPVESLPPPRIFDSYFLPGHSHLTFWHDSPQVHGNASSKELGEYYMPETESVDFIGSGLAEKVTGSLAENE
jgi:hypothetical protein